ncbi:hypothetical protein b3_0117 [Synechococcus phage B3]|jgi:hypothetical protein|nr:hypothetical protein b3_0117 [Synechococcus phage B3]QGT54731.1 hypothetical protein b23_0116 [Synechococcus phage B23]
MLIESQESTIMRKFNLDFIGEIVSSPAGKSTWCGTTIRFYGKFKEPEIAYQRYRRENLIEAIEIKDRPPEGYHMCSAFQVIPEQYLYLKN